MGQNEKQKLTWVRHFSGEASRMEKMTKVKGQARWTMSFLLWSQDVMLIAAPEFQAGTYTEPESRWLLLLILNQGFGFPPSVGNWEQGKAGHGLLC